jgi:hypothetical protein
MASLNHASLSAVKQQKLNTWLQKPAGKRISDSLPMAYAKNTG